MHLIDAHNHIHLPDFSPHLSEVIWFARSRGVVLQLVNATCFKDWNALKELCANHRDIVPFYGLHPWYKEEDEGWTRELEAIISSTPCGIGEIGLDRWKKGVDTVFQEKAFISQLELAQKYSRPVTIHCLKAWGRLLEILQNFRLSGGILIHSFNGSHETMSKLLELGAFFSFSGYITHPQKNKARKTAQQVPQDRIMVESDAPDMLPPLDIVLHKIYKDDGSLLNSPANLPAIYNYLAKLRKVDVESFARQVMENVNFFLGVLNIARPIFKD